MVNRGRPAGLYSYLYENFWSEPALHCSRAALIGRRTVRLTFNKFRALAVTTAKRSPSFPDAPTVAEAAVPGFEASAWFGLIGPRECRTISCNFSTRLARACSPTAVREKIKGLGAEARHSSPKEITDLIATDIKRWSEVIDRENTRG